MDCADEVKLILDELKPLPEWKEPAPASALVLRGDWYDWIQILIGCWWVMAAREPHAGSRARRNRCRQRSLVFRSTERLLS